MYVNIYLFRFSFKSQFLVLIMTHYSYNSPIIELKYKR